MAAELVDDRYEVVRVLSSGRAVVAQGRDLLHDRLVALKIYSTVDVDRAAVLAETRALMRLEPHPSLPVVRGDFFTADGERYVLVMNWIEGTDMQTLLDDEGSVGLDPHDALDALAQVADALDHLHTHDPPLVHGDVKPANIVRSNSGRVVLVDFDLASAQEARIRAGTVGYVAPEVAAGEPATAAADVYGLAACAVTLLVGHAPVAGHSTAGTAPTAGAADLVRIATAGLAADPARRPATAGDLVSQMQHGRTARRPSGSVAVVVVDLLLTGADPESRRRAHERLADVVQRHRGHVSGIAYSSSIAAVFRSVTDAARASLEFGHGTDAASASGPTVRSRAALCVGDATPTDDNTYQGAAIDTAVQLCSLAMAGTTITTERTAELLTGMVGSELSIVPLPAASGDAILGRPRLFSVVRPGDEDHVAAIEPSEAARLAGVGASHDTSLKSTILGILDHPLVASALALVGLALMARFVVAPVIDLEGVANVGVAVTATLAVAGVVFTSSASFRRRRAAVSAARQREIEADIASRRARDQLATRHRLAATLAPLQEGLARDAMRALTTLGNEFDAVCDMLRQANDIDLLDIAATLPDLASATYDQGIRSLDVAAELLRSSIVTNRQQLTRDLADLERRLSNASDHWHERHGDELRYASLQRQLERDEATLERVFGFIVEGERCGAALSDARLELAAAVAGDARISVDRAVSALTETAKVVRNVSDEVRGLEP